MTVVMARVASVESRLSSGRQQPLVPNMEASADAAEFRA